jgi:release factor glutamine methyltransferase
MNTKPISSGRSASRLDVTSAPPMLAAAAPQSAATLLADATACLVAGSDSPRLDAELLLAFATGRSRSSLYAFPERTIELAVVARFTDLVARRASGEPLAYLTGSREFFSLDLIVSGDVLVPRPETELLVEAALARCAVLPRARVLDLGTGSGAIALAIKRGCPDAEVTASDASAAALGVARRNGARLALAVRFVESRWFEALAGERFDLIVTNPPYVRSGEIAGALAHEPSLALDGGRDGLEAYRAILAVAPRHLSSGGLLLLEHGHDQRGSLATLAGTLGWCVTAALDDLEGRARVLALVQGKNA